MDEYDVDCKFCASPVRKNPVHHPTMYECGTLSDYSHRGDVCRTITQTLVDGKYVRMSRDEVIALRDKVNSM